MNLANHPIWWLLSVACLVWYSTITIYVAIKGAADIKEMLGKLGQPPPTEPPESSQR
jgi:hypothetical protein